MGESGLSDEDWQPPQRARRHHHRAAADHRLHYNHRPAVGHRYYLHRVATGRIHSRDRRNGCHVALHSQTFTGGGGAAAAIRTPGLLAAR